MDTTHINLLLVDAQATFEELQKIIDQARESQQRQLAVIELLEKEKHKIEASEYNANNDRNYGLLFEGFRNHDMQLMGVEYGDGFAYTRLPVTRTKYDRLFVKFRRDGYVDIMGEIGGQFAIAENLSHLFLTQKEVKRIISILYSKLGSS